MKIYFTRRFRNKKLSVENILKEIDAEGREAVNKSVFTNQADN